MQAVRSDACAVTYGNKIIVVGGFTGDEIHDSIEIYNSSTNEWNYGPRLNIPRSGLKVICNTCATLTISIILLQLLIASCLGSNLTG